MVNRIHSSKLQKVSLALLILFSAVIGIRSIARSQSGTNPEISGGRIVGIIMDSQGHPVHDVEVFVSNSLDDEPIAETTTQPDGSFSIKTQEWIPSDLTISFSRAHFESTEIFLDRSHVDDLITGKTVSLEEIIMERHIGIAFWIATLIFVCMLGLIATETLHNTLAALLGVSLLFGISYLGGAINDSLFIYEFTTAIDFVDWNVIFLIMGMMMFVAVVERTGVFSWLAFWAYQISGGRVWLLLPILMLITGVASAILDNVTTMLLMTPISVQIALALGISPLALLIPEVMASNVVGISTLIGTPTNILIGSYADLSFSDFLLNLTPGVIVAFVGLVLYSEWAYRRELKSGQSISERLLEKLAEGAKIAEPEDLKKAGIVGGAMLLLFIFGEQFHLLPSITAIMGSTALLVWIKPDLEEMIESVDWTTLVFFMALFIVIGAVEEVGLINVIAQFIGNLVGDNLLVALISVTWFSAILSGLIDNIPFTAAMLPVVGYLTTTVPGADSLVLFYALSVGAAMGGNSTLIGSSPNMVTAGISERAGYRITYMEFLKKGVPVMFITVSIGVIWLIIRFL